MNFVEIKKEAKVFPGEYLLYSPTQQVVLCGAFNRKENYIRAFGSGRYVEDTIENFKKIELDTQSRQDMKAKRGRCKGCGKG